MGEANEYLKKIRLVILIWGLAILFLMIPGVAAALPQTGIRSCPTGDPQKLTIFLPIFLVPEKNAAHTRVSRKMAMGYEGSDMNISVRFGLLDELSFVSQDP